MLSRIDPKSQDFVTEDLDFSTLPATQCGIINSRYTHIPLKNQITDNGPWELNLTNNNRSYLNPKKTYVVFTFEITGRDGEHVEMIPLTDGSTGGRLYAPINNIAHSIIKTYSLHINGQMVFHNSTNYAYQAYLESVLMYGEEAKNSTLTAAGFYHDTQIGSVNSPGFMKRCEQVKKKGQVQVACNISIDLMKQSKVLINGCNVKLILYPNNSEFLIEGHNIDNMKFKVVDVHAIVNEFDLAEGLSNELEAALLENKMLQYPLISSQVRSFYIEPNRFDAPANTVFTSKLPRRIFVGLVSAKSYQGSYDTSPFNFQHFGLTDIHIDFCGQSVPSRPFNLDFDNGKFIEPYIRLQEALGHARTNLTCNSISTEMFQKLGYTIFGFELSPIAQDHNLFELVRQTNIGIRLSFGKKTPEGGLYAIVYGEFDNCLNIGWDRTPVIPTVI